MSVTVVVCVPWVGTNTGELGLSEIVDVLWLELVMCGGVRENESLSCWWWWWVVVS